MNVSDLIEAVKVCIDEIGVNESEMIGGEDNADMRTIIQSKIVDGMNYVKGNADWALLEPDKYLDDTQAYSVDENKVVRLTLPNDFLRLCYARLSSWPVSLSDPTYWDDAEYALLQDTYSSGTHERPKLAMSIGKDGRQLEFYKAKDVERVESVDESGNKTTVYSTTDVPDVGYIQKFTNAGVGSLDIPDKLERALVYYVAGLTLLTYRDEHADALFNQAKVIMGIV